MKEIFANAWGRFRKGVGNCRDMVKTGPGRVKNAITGFDKLVEQKLGAETRERNRFILLSLSLVFLADYMMICVHTDRWIFDIFPSFPAIERKDDVVIHLPTLDGTIISEKRSIPSIENRENLAIHLLKEVCRGSYYENTRIMVPVEMIVKKVWFTGEADGKLICVIDIDPVTIKDDIEVIPGSEKLFREALRSTIADNIPGVEDVILLEKGIARLALWDVR